MHSGHAAGFDCDHEGGSSPCLDANALWLAAAPARLVSMPDALPLVARRVSSGLGLEYLSRPVVAKARSPAADGREVPLVRDAVVATWLWAFGIGLGTELSAALPLTLHQEGSGAQGLVTQRSEPLPATALRDPRLSVGTSFLDLPPRSLVLGVGPLTGRFDLTLALPLGQTDRLAGNGSVTVAPRASTALRFAPGFVAASLGARWREPTGLAGARFGTAATVNVGIGVDLFGRELLTMSLEAWAAPELRAQTRTLPDGSSVGATLIPAEWLVSFRSMPLVRERLSLQLGAGTALPLSEERRYDSAGTVTEERFAGATAAAVRLVLMAKYEPPALEF